MTSLENIKKIITKSNWTLAKSIPNSPHWYILRKECITAEFDLFANFIHSNGVLRKWGTYGYLFLDIESYTYWSMNNSDGGKVIINRADISTSMNGNTNQIYKKCPNCKRLTAESEFKKFTKIINGLARTFWRCPVCDEFKKAAKKSFKNK
jgi:hypothetical protein